MQVTIDKFKFGHGPFYSDCILCCCLESRRLKDPEMAFCISDFVSDICLICSLYIVISTCVQLKPPFAFGPEVP